MLSLQKTDTVFINVFFILILNNKRKLIRVKNILKFFSKKYVLFC